MEISVNGEIISTKASNLGALLLELNYEGDWLATAVNAELVAAEQRFELLLKTGDKVEILSPMQGG